MLNSIQFFQSRLLFRSTSLLMNTSVKRNVRVQHKLFRKRLPKYKIDLNRIPPLTELLTSNEELIGKKALDDLRQKKLDVYKSYVPVNSNTNLLEALFSTRNSIDDLLQIIDENLCTMTSFYIGVSFEILDDIIQSGLCERETVAVSPEFMNLCSRTLYKLRFFESDELLKLIKCLSTVRIPEDTLILQGALEMCRHLINDFEVMELEALHDALSRIEHKKEKNFSLLSATLAAIPLVKEKHLKERRIPKDYILLQDSVRGEDV